jgi:hypothetical protein
VGRLFKRHPADVEAQEFQALLRQLTNEFGW